jgi:hypothetical protein
MAENFQRLLRTFRDRLDRNYKVFGGSFARPQDMSFLPDAESSLLSNEPINGLNMRAAQDVALIYAQKSTVLGA